MQKSTCRAFETILVTDKIAQNLRYHENRMNRTRHELFRCNDWLRIELEPTDFTTPHRCKVIYASAIEEIKIEPYTKREIKKLSLIDADINYEYKLIDRTKLDRLFAMRGDADDVIIVRDRLLTDTTIANIALHDGTQWLTPKTPLLKGTMRQKLLDDGFLTEADILASELMKFEKIAVINALRGFEEVKNTISTTFRL